MQQLTRFCSPIGRLRTALRRRLSHLPCRGCLGPLDLDAEAGLCGACWSGLVPLAEGRCPRCALLHDAEAGCPDRVAWTCGDALWDYHGGRPPLGALLLPGIKNGELGWRDVLLGRISGIPIPAFALDADLVTAAPTAFHRRWMRGFDLAEDVARLLARRLERPFARTLRKAWVTRRQAGRTESERRRLPGKSIRPLRGADLEGRTVLLVDDVWTTGTTLLRSAQALQAAGAKEVRILTLFRAV